MCVDLVLLLFVLLEGVLIDNPTLHERILISDLNAEVLRQLVLSQFLADHRLQRVANRVTQQHVLPQVVNLHPVFRDVEHAVTSHDQLQQCLVKHHPVVTGFDAAQH